MRREAVLATGGARAWFEVAEDIDLQVRLAFQGSVWHDTAPVYGYRLHDASITHTRKAAQLAFFDRAVQTLAAQRRDTGTDDLDRGAPPPRRHSLQRTARGMPRQIISSDIWCRRRGRIFRTDARPRAFAAC